MSIISLGMGGSADTFDVKVNVSTVDIEVAVEEIEEIKVDVSEIEEIEVVIETVEIETDMEIVEINTNTGDCNGD